MTYDQLKKFITEDMQMQHIYQPVMLIELLRHKGKRSVGKIAQAILDRDPSQIEYYTEIVKRMPGRVLTANRGIAIKEGNNYILPVGQNLSEIDRRNLISLCEQKIAEYEAKKEGAHWDHRRKGRRPVSGSVRYEVLKRALFRCELCGVAADEKNLEVDHIVPKNWQGKDDLSNYQALCYTCNAQKQDKDATDFRGLKTHYDLREEDCLFCDIQTKDRGRIVEENTLAYAIRDGFPVTQYHTLIIPKRHTLDFFGLTQAELNAINSLIHSQKKVIEGLDKTVEGFNIGANCGEIAGQSVWHCHIHLIPRRRGDVERPKGGVRHVIPNMGHYEAGK
jgi:diadenosine tetraphosphate (Ap4A) HIT family hydrolase